MKPLATLANLVGCVLSAAGMVFLVPGLLLMDYASAQRDAPPERDPSRIAPRQGYPGRLPFV